VLLALRLRETAVDLTLAGFLLLAAIEGRGVNYAA
jgi:hypothetical protein